VSGNRIKDRKNMDLDREENGIRVKKGLVIPMDEISFTFCASSGPGGQKVNKTATKARLKWNPLASPAMKGFLSSNELERFLKRVKPLLAEDGSFQVVSDSSRSRETNRQDCMKKLGKRIAGWLRKPKKRVSTKPTRASVERRLKQKKRDSRIKKERRRPAEED